MKQILNLAGFAVALDSKEKGAEYSHLGDLLNYWLGRRYGVRWSSGCPGPCTSVVVPSAFIFWSVFA